MGRWLYVLLVFVPAAVVARATGLSDLLVFSASALGLIPLAGLIGRATEELAHHLGPRFGGLLNATFGNAAELIITAFAVQRGLLTLAKASITGAIIGNTLLVLGVSLLAGGLRNGRQRYDARDASLNAALMILAIAGLYMPAAFAATGQTHALIEELSILVAVIMLLVYGAYLVFTVFGNGQPDEGKVASDHSAGAPAMAPAHQAIAPVATEPAWSVRRSLLVLGGATVGAAVSSELLVGAVEHVTQQLGWSEFFVGVIIVAIIGNASEHFSAVQMAWRNRLDLTLAIAAGSSTQIALFVAPFLVLLSLVLGNPMDLVFEPLELTVLGLTTAIFAYISLDGESTWLEGVQLLALYLIAGVVFFLYRGAQ